jgi:hypothetical protein
MRSQYFALIMLIYALDSSVKADWRHCSGPQTFILNVTDVSIFPQPISAGSVVHFQILGYLDNAIFSGTLEASVKYLSVRVFKKSGELCTTPGVKCPLLSGFISLDLEETMPGFLPPGKMGLTLKAARNDSLPLFCIDIDLNGNKNIAPAKNKTPAVASSPSSSIIEESAVDTMRR